MNRLLPLTACLALPLIALSQPATPHADHADHHAHPDPEAYIAMLDNPERDNYQMPQEVVAALKLKKGEVIADIGAGSGYFTFRLAQHVGKRGRVFAVDVNPDMIIHLNRRIRDLQVNNVVSILATPDDPLLADASVDRFFICNTWHHIDHRDEYLALMKKMLRPNGQVVMVDFRKAESPMGPPLEMRIAREDLVREMERNGFEIAAEHTFLPYQYVIVFNVKPHSP